MATLLFNVKPNDPVVFALGSAAVRGVALLASYMPARRALAGGPDGGAAVRVKPRQTPGSLFLRILMSSRLIF